MYKIFFILSILLIIISPDEYSTLFCSIMLVLYITTWFYDFINNKRFGIFTYTFLFSFAYLFVFFVYPVFLYNSEFRDYSLFAYYFNSNYIPYCTAIAYSCYTSFLLGCNTKFNNLKIKANILNDKIIKKIVKYLLIVSLGLFVYFIFTGGSLLFSKQYQGLELNSSDGVSQYIYVLLSTLIITLTIVTFYLNNTKSLLFKLSLCFCCLVAFYILMTGFRTFTINVGVVVLTMYNDKIKRISYKNAILLIILGLIVMNGVGIMRNEGVAIENINATLETYEEKGNDLGFANDLIMNNRSLYFLVEYADNNGYTWGITLLGGILSVIPFASNIFLSLTGLPSDYLGSATYNTYLTLGKIRSIGIGTNVVADVYIAFGLIGALILFYYFGKSIKYFRDKSHNDFYAGIIYYALISRVIFTPRSGILLNLQLCIWSIVIIFLISKIISYSKSLN